MDLGWHLDNPAIALAMYKEDLDTFGKKKASNEVLGDELLAKQSELSAKTVELEGLKDKLSAMGAYVADDTEAAIQTVVDETQRGIDKEMEEFNSQKSNLSKQQDSDLKANDEWLKTRLAQLTGGDADVDRELTDTEKKALEFEIERKRFVSASNEKINDCQDAIVQEQLDCQTVVGELKNKQDKIYSKYEPDLTKY